MADVTPPANDEQTLDQELADALGVGAEGSLTDNAAPEITLGRETDDSTDDADTKAEDTATSEDESDDKGDTSEAGDDRPDDGTGDKGVSSDSSEIDESVRETAGGTETTEPADELKDETKTEDPGIEFTPKTDYSFEITTTDGKTHKISSQAEVDAFAEQLDEKPDLISASQYTRFNTNVARMAVGMEQEKVAWDNQKQQYETEQALEQTRQNTVTEIGNGFNYLESKGELVALTPEMTVAGAWEKNPDNPAVKQRLDILAYMDTENKARMNAGLTPNFDVIAAHTAMQLEALRKQETETKQTEVSNRQKRGSVVTGKSAYISENQPAGSIVGEGGSLSDLLIDY